MNNHIEENKFDEVFKNLGIYEMVKNEPYLIKYTLINKLIKQMNKMEKINEHFEMLLESSKNIVK